MPYASRRSQADAKVSEWIRKELETIGDHYMLDLDAAFATPKKGVDYHAERSVQFAAGLQASGENQLVSFTVNRGKVRGGKGKKRAKGARSSAPGEAPAIQTAALRKSIRARIVHLNKTAWALRIGVSIQGGRGSPQGRTGRSIANDLEFGTSTMRPRPAWRPVLVKLRAWMATRRSGANHSGTFTGGGGGRQ